MSLVVPLGGTLAAQAGTKDTKAIPVPESAMPPAGMCRVWLRDVAERQQPAPTDCAAAIKSMPRDAQVLFGDLKRAATVAVPGSSSAGAAAAALGQGNGIRDMPSFRGAGGNNGELRSASQMQAARAAAVRPGVVGVSATEPAAAKAPPAKGVIKPEIPQ